MSDWPTIPVRDLVESITTWNPMRADHEEVFDYIDLSAIDQASKVILGAREVACGEAPSRARQLVATDDILVSTVRPNLNAIAKVTPELDGATASTGFCVLRPRPNLLTSSYLFHWVKSPQFVADMVGKATGASYPAVSDRIIFDSPIPAPPLSEQRRIAAILDQADALRGKRREALAQLDSLTQSIFIEMFGDPQENPKKWPLHRLDTLFSASPIFGTMIPGVADHGQHLCLRVANIQNWQLDLTDKKYVDLPDSVLERHSVKDGDLLLARAIATQELLGKCIVARPGNNQWAFDSHLMRLRFRNDRAEPDFIRQALRTSGGRSIFLACSRKSSVQYNINTKEMAALQLPIPPMDLQKSFLGQLQATESLKNANRNALAELDTLFASLQHRAFRGEL